MNSSDNKKSDDNEVFLDAAAYGMGSRTTPTIDSDVVLPQQMEDAKEAPVLPTEGRSLDGRFSSISEAFSEIADESSTTPGTTTYSTTPDLFQQQMPPQEEEQPESTTVALPQSPGYRYGGFPPPSTGAFPGFDFVSAGEERKMAAASALDDSMASATAPPSDQITGNRHAGDLLRLPAAQPPWTDSTPATRYPLPAEYPPSSIDPVKKNARNIPHDHFLMVQRHDQQMFQGQLALQQEEYYYALMQQQQQQQQQVAASSFHNQIPIQQGSIGSTYYATTRMQPPGNTTMPYMTQAAAPLLPMSHQDGMSFASMSLAGSGSSVASVHPPDVTNSDFLPKKQKKRDKEKPKRPLSAYNIFFKEERSRMLSKLEESKNGKKVPSKEHVEGDSVDDLKREEESNSSSNNTAIFSSDAPVSPKRVEVTSDETKQKRKKTRHGISFETMAKEIGSRWKVVEPVRLDEYQKRADEDKKRYEIEMALYAAKKRIELEKERAQLESTVSEEMKRRYMSPGGN